MRVLPQLGRALERAITAVRARGLARLVRALQREPESAQGLLATFAATAYVRGGLVGYAIHGAYLGAPREPPRRTLEAFAGRGLEHGRLMVSRLERLLEREPEQRFPLDRWADLVGEQAVWRGQDEGSLDVALEQEVDTKTWVRSFGRREHRSWHDRLEGVTIPVDDLFILPGGDNAGTRVYGPRDWTAVPDVGEWSSCGHALAFMRGADVLIEAPRVTARKR